MVVGKGCYFCVDVVDCCYVQRLEYVEGVLFYLQFGEQCKWGCNLCGEFVVEKHVLNDIEVVVECEVLIDGFDFEVCGVVGCVDLHLVFFEDDRFFVGYVRFCDTFDQR